MFYRVGLNASAPVYNAKNKDGSKVASQSTGSKQHNFDTINFASTLSEEQTRIKDFVSTIAQKAHVRPTFQELDNLKSLVDSGEYTPNSEEIATRMLLMGQ